MISKRKKNVFVCNVEYKILNCGVVSVATNTQLPQKVWKFTTKWATSSFKRQTLIIVLVSYEMFTSIVF
jgi:hypothetical protein